MFTGIVEELGRLRPPNANLSTLGTKGPGSLVSLEVHVVASCTERLLEGDAGAGCPENEEKSHR